MSCSSPRAWLICYDIADPRRLGRLHRFLKTRALPVQYSVFHFEGSSAQLGRLLQDIKAHIKPKEDDVRAYPIPDAVQLHTLGRGVLPDDLQLRSERSPGLDTLLRPGKATS